MCGCPSENGKPRTFSEQYLAVSSLSTSKRFSQKQGHGHSIWTREHHVVSHHHVIYTFFILLRLYTWFFLKQTQSIYLLKYLESTSAGKKQLRPSLLPVFTKSQFFPILHKFHKLLNVYVIGYKRSK